MYSIHQIERFVKSWGCNKGMATLGMGIHNDRVLDMPLRVDIQCVECILEGSPAVSQLQLQDRVTFDVHTCFKCQQGTGKSLLHVFACSADG